ncbi:multiheme c-type cytochrome [Acuticoccus kandeliae]|uniref:multiheme c-type cytochrome n=1 Tax=Acuticoccus kandeliae TaxID=2073160 RepID=UPI001B3BCE74|nr:multiheme c-type cytochrome [Acuticoccus kandeliae]
MKLKLSLTALLVALSTFLAPMAVGQDAPDYVGSATCATCHMDVTERWAGSDHALAWTKPTAETVKADFHGTEFTHDGMTARFRVEKGSYYVTVTEKDGTTRDYRVHSVAGVKPLQQYLIETEPGRLQSFDVVWDTEKGGWFHLYPDQNLPPSDALHWTGPYKNWNGRCAVCHATGFEKNYDPHAKTFASTAVEISVGCEACHGPGSAHVDAARAPGGAASPVPLLMSKATEPQAMIEQCAGCHSRRAAYEADSPTPGTPYHDSYQLSVLRPGLYHADGQILDEVYVYGSFLQSKMYARGVTCLNCHDPHSTELKAEGNAVCTQCHNPAGNPAFPTLRPADYDSPAHTFHAEGTEGAACKSCHMVERVYMGNDWRADHSFRIPRPDLSAATGAPDACTTCHTDRDAAWAADQIAAWYPDPRNRGPHYGTVFARGRENPAAAAGDLAAIVEDEGQSGIVRATALSLLEGSGDAAIAERLATYLADDDPLVRSAAVSIQRLAPPQDRVLRLLDLLDDPSRSVRMEAARALLDAPIARLPGVHAQNLQNALAEWRASLASNLDFPETHLQLGGLALVMRNAPAASAAFREVVEMDPQRIDAWVMLARIAASTEGTNAATQILRDAHAANPDDPTIRAYLGLPAGAN